MISPRRSAIASSIASQAFPRLLSIPIHIATAKQALIIIRRPSITCKKLCALLCNAKVVIVFASSPAGELGGMLL